MHGLPRRFAPRNDGDLAVIASEARQSMNPDTLDCHVTTFLAMTVIWLSLRAKRGNP
jgi:hypothetical protein